MYMYGFTLPYGAPFNIFLLIALLWTIPWKGYALWLSARNTHKVWFIILLLVNTLGILEIIYIFAISRRTKKEPVAIDTE